MTKIVAYIRLFIFIYLLDKWVFSPIVSLSKHKGPFVVVRNYTPKPAKRRRNSTMSNPVKKVLNTKLAAGLTVMAVLFIGVIVLGVLAIYNRLSASNPVKKAVEGAGSTEAPSTGA